VLEFERAGGVVAVDLRRPVDRTMLPFDGSPFGVITACNPLGRVLSERENADRDAALHRRLDQLSYAYVRATGRSPDASHAERGFAVAAPREVLLALAEEFDQLAIFWFDGSSMWIWPVDGPAIALPSPRSSWHADAAPPSS
jgi:hypothetical protein